MPEKKGYSEKVSPATIEAIEEMGRNGDTMIAHINPQEAILLTLMGGSGTVNPDTGILEFFGGGDNSGAAGGGEHEGGGVGAGGGNAGVGSSDSDSSGGPDSSSAGDSDGTGEGLGGFGDFGIDTADANALGAFGIGDVQDSFGMGFGQAVADNQNERAGIFGPDFSVVGNQVVSQNFAQKATDALVGMLSFGLIDPNIGTQVTGPQMDVSNPTANPLGALANAVGLGPVVGALGLMGVDVDEALGTQIGLGEFGLGTDGDGNNASTGGDNNGRGGEEDGRDARQQVAQLIPQEDDSFESFRQRVDDIFTDITQNFEFFDTPEFELLEPRESRFSFAPELPGDDG